MPLCADVAAAMAGYGFERILALPALPGHNRTEHDYATVVVTGSGERWSLRSPGTGFSLVARAWVRDGLTRCYSLGWGLAADGRSTGLLLAQAFESDPAEARDLGRRVARELGPAATWSVDELWGRACLRIAAEVRDGRDG